MKTTISAATDNYFDACVRFLQDIIAIPSVCGDEAAVIARIEQEMKSLGYDQVRIDGLGNLIGRIGSGERIVAIDGHCDTVDAGSRENWETDPFSGKLKNGIIHGRGAADQKGGLASAVYAGRILQEIGLPEDVTLLVVASVLEEEYEGLCWQHIVQEEKIIPECIVLTEPSNLAVAVGQRGRLEINLSTDGISCHGSAPERGENAVYKMASVIREIEKLNDLLHSDSILGKGSITVTNIRSSAPSLCAVPDSATIRLDRRLTVDETMESCLEEIEALKSVRETGARLSVPEHDVRSHKGLDKRIKAYYPTWLMEDDHPIVQTAVTAYTNQLKKEPAVMPWTFSTNGVATKGLFDIPTIGFGPGEERFAHAPNEQLRAEDLKTAMAFYTAFVQHFHHGDTRRKR